MHARKEQVNFSEFEEMQLLSDAVFVRSGRTRARSYTAPGKLYKFSFCKTDGHNKRKFPKLKYRCSRCKVLGHTCQARDMPLSQFRNAILTDEQAAEQERMKIIRRQDAAHAAWTRRAARVGAANANVSAQELTNVPPNSQELTQTDAKKPLNDFNDDAIVNGLDELTKCRWVY